MKTTSRSSSPATRSRSTPTAALFSALVAAGLAMPAHAADGTWTKTASGGLWSAIANWSGGTVADGSGFTANFSTLNITADNTVAMDATHTLTNLTFADATTASNGWTLSNNGNAANILTLAGTTPTITVGALGTGKTATISAVIDGTDGLTVAGTGTLNLSGANTYSGTTTVNSGSTLMIGTTSVLTGSAVSSGATGKSNVTFANGASLNNSTNTNAWYVPTITLVGTLNLLGNNRLNMAFKTMELTSGTKTINVNGKSVAVSGAAGNTLAGGETTGLSQWEMQSTTNLGTSTIQSSGGAGVGVLDLETTAFSGSNYAAMRINNATTFSNTDLIIGNNVLLFAGNTGTLGTSAATSPNVTVNGILNLVASSATGRTVNVKSLTGTGSVFGSMVSTITTAGITTQNTNTTTLALNGTTGSTTTFDGVISNGAGGTLSLTKTGASTQILTGTNNFTGTTSVTLGTLATGSTGTFGSGNISVGAATLTLGNASSIADTASLALVTGSVLNLNFSSGLFETVSGLTLNGSSAFLSSITGTAIAGGTQYALADLTAFNSSMFTGTGGGFIVSAIPEPATYAALAGLGILGFAIYRRRKTS